jgi:anaerobic ribonucleoside-triphosphate reductase activating protein
MLKYLYCKEIFREIPDEITLGISISGCLIRCEGCNQRELWEDKGEELSMIALNDLIKNHKGITCVCLFGGEHDITTLKMLFSMVRHKYGLKTAWYCGLDLLPKAHLDMPTYVDYLKLGHFDMELGGLDSPTTNQRLYKIEHLGSGDYCETDITFKLQKQN